MSTTEVKRSPRTLSVIRAYSKATGKYPGAIAAILIGGLVTQVVSVTTPLYLKQLINIIAEGSPSATVVHSLFVILAIYAGLGLVNWLSRKVESTGINSMTTDVMADLSNDALANLVRHSHDFFISNFAGSLTRRVTRYARAYEQILNGFIYNFYHTLIFSVGAIYVLYLRNHWLGLGILVWMITFIILQIVLTRWRYPLRLLRVAADTKMTGVVSDVIGNQSAVTLFAAEAFEGRNFAQVVESWRLATRAASRASNTQQFAQQALAIVVEIALLGGGIKLWSLGLITVGDFVLIQVYILSLIDQVWNIGNTIRNLYDSFAEASEMVEIMETPFGIQDNPEASALVSTKGEIVFDGLSFFFTPERPILSNYSLHISGGEKVALVGSSGAGKSTVTKLLLRLYDPKSGSITIDGQDIREVRPESLRRAISFVPQEPALFHRTLRENIAYGKEGASLEEVIEAAKSAHCHEFISALPEGYETYVGERGVKLSGGERQRIAIARAILKNAPILVLDEATSSLDSESEQLIQEALEKLMVGKTVIAIAHRLSTIMKMDRILVMEKGEIILSGTHQELLAQESNLYKKLWEIQAGGFIGGNDDETDGEAE